MKFSNSSNSLLPLRRIILVRNCVSFAVIEEESLNRTRSKNFVVTKALNVKRRLLGRHNRMESLNGATGPFTTQGQPCCSKQNLPTKLWAEDLAACSFLRKKPLTVKCEPWRDTVSKMVQRITRYIKPPCVWMCR